MFNIIKWREGANAPLFPPDFLVWQGYLPLVDDIEDEYITDTQLSILQESRTSLNYLLKIQPMELLPEHILKLERIY